MGLLHGQKAQAAAAGPARGGAGGGGAQGGGGRQGEEAFYAMLSEDLFTYTESIVKSLCRTIPKAVVNGMVQKAELELLDCMYEKVSNMDAIELSVFSSPEDSEVLQKRAGHEAALGDLDAALGALGEAAEQGRGLDTVRVPAWVLELAGMLPKVCPPQLSPSKYLPKVLLEGAGTGVSARSTSPRPKPPARAPPGASSHRRTAQTPPPRLQVPDPGAGAPPKGASSAGPAKPRRRPPPPPPPTAAGGAKPRRR